MLRIGPFLFAAGVLTGSALLLAQEKPLPRPVLVDKVVATVNDSAILHSDLLTLMDAELRGREASGKRVRPEDRLTIYDEVLRKDIERHTWAQAAKTFGYLPPEQVEAWFQREMEKDEQNLVRDLGGYQAAMRALQNQGRTWPSWVREQRVDKFAKFAQGYSISMRMQRQANLYVTPRMLRETFEFAKNRFVHEAEAAVSSVTFTGPDAKTNAEKAAAMWRTEDVKARALAQRFPGATAVDTMAANALVADLAAFAREGPVDRVSDPIDRGNGTVTIAKIVVFVPARDGKFEDVDVQVELRRICEQLVEGEFTMQALERAKQRTEVWRSRPAR